MADHLRNTSGEISRTMIRAHLESLAYSGLCDPAEVEDLCQAVDDELTASAENNTITVSIKDA